MVSGSEAEQLFGVHLDGTPCSNMSSCTTGVMATGVGDLDRADELTHPPSIT